MNDTAKVQLFYSFLKSNGRIKDRKEFGEKLGYHNKSSFSRVMNNPTENFISNLVSVYPEYLHFSPPTTELKPKHYPSFTEVKVVTSKARAGYSEAYYAEEYLADLPTILIESDKEYKGKYLAFEVDGDSMEPEYYAGDIVICREVKRDLWQYKLHYKDYDFVIAHGTKGIMLKEIIEHNTETGEIVCHSLNSTHADFTLNIGEIAFLYNVVEVRLNGKRRRMRR